MIMVEMFKGAANQGITEVNRPAHRYNAARQALAKAEVNRFPRYFFTVFDQAGGAAGDGSFVVFRLAGYVGVDAASEVENRLNGSGDFDADFDTGHGSLQYA